MKWQAQVMLLIGVYLLALFLAARQLLPVGGRQQVWVVVWALCSLVALALGLAAMRWALLAGLVVQLGWFIPLFGLFREKLGNPLTAGLAAAGVVAVLAAEWGWLLWQVGRDGEKASD